MGLGVARQRSCWGCRWYQPRCPEPPCAHPAWGARSLQAALCWPVPPSAAPQVFIQLLLEWGDLREDGGHRACSQSQGRFGKKEKKPQPIHRSSRVRAHRGSAMLHITSTAQRRVQLQHWLPGCYNHASSLHPSPRLWVLSIRTENTQVTL